VHRARVAKDFGVFGHLFLELVRRGSGKCEEATVFPFLAKAKHEADDGGTLARSWPSENPSVL